MIGADEETTTELVSKNELLYFVTNTYGCRHSLNDGIMRATDLMIVMWARVALPFSVVLVLVRSLLI